MIIDAVAAEVGIISKEKARRQAAQTLEELIQSKSKIAKIIFKICIEIIHKDHFESLAS